MKQNIWRNLNHECYILGRYTTFVSFGVGMVFEITSGKALRFWVMSPNYYVEHKISFFLFLLGLNSSFRMDYMGIYSSDNFFKL